jgi:predicted carbohydrate-binding protein with CBM5 and CBM33 domain
MRPFTLLLGVLSLAGLVSFGRAASAQCVVADVSIQAAITGSQKPAEQTNEVSVEAQEGCSGSTSVNTSRQVTVGGTGPVQQTRQSQHRIGGSTSGRAVTGPTVVVPVEVQVDVYNPAERLRQQRRQ